MNTIELTEANIRGLHERIENLTLENARLADFLCFVQSRYPEIYPAYKTALSDLAVKLSNEYSEINKDKT